MPLKNLFHIFDFSYRELDTDCLRFSFLCFFNVGILCGQNIPSQVLANGRLEP